MSSSASNEDETYVTSQTRRWGPQYVDRNLEMQLEDHPDTLKGLYPREMCLNVAYQSTFGRIKAHSLGQKACVWSDTYPFIGVWSMMFCHGRTLELILARMHWVCRDYSWKNFVLLIGWARLSMAWDRLQSTLLHRASYSQHKNVPYRWTWAPTTLKMTTLTHYNVICQHLINLSLHKFSFCRC